MAQIFDRRANTIAKGSILIGLPLLLAIAGAAWWFYSRSDWVRDVGIPVTQPGSGAPLIRVRSLVRVQDGPPEES